MATELKLLIPVRYADGSPVEDLRGHTDWRDVRGGSREEEFDFAALAQERHRAVYSPVETVPAFRCGRAANATTGISWRSESAGPIVSWTWAVGPGEWACT